MSHKLAVIKEGSKEDKDFIEGLYELSPGEIKTINALKSSESEKDDTRQTLFSLNAIAELIDNSIDAVLKRYGILYVLGRYGRGALQVLGLIQGDGDYVSYKTAGSDLVKKMLVYFRDKIGRIALDFQEEGEASHQGTTVYARSTFFDGKADKLIAEIKRVYSRSDAMAIYLNGEHINPLGKYEILSGDENRNGIRASYWVPESQSRLDIRITTDHQGHTTLEIEDGGTGMTSKILLSSLPSPGLGSNTPENLKKIQEDSKGHHTEALMDKTPSDRVTLYFNVGGRNIEGGVIPSEGGGIQEVIIKLPVTSTLTEAKNMIVVTKELSDAFYQLSENCLKAKGQKNFIPTLNSFLAIAQELDNRSQNEYSFVKRFLEQVRKSGVLLEYKENHSIVFLPDMTGVGRIKVPEGKNVLILNQEFFKAMPELLENSFKMIENYQGVAFIVPLKEGQKGSFNERVGPVWFVDEQSAQAVATLGGIGTGLLNQALREVGGLGTVQKGGEDTLGVRRELNVLEAFKGMTEAEQAVVLERLSKLGINPSDLQRIISENLTPAPGTGASFQAAQRGVSNDQEFGKKQRLELINRASKKGRARLVVRMIVEFLKAYPETSDDDAGNIITNILKGNSRYGGDKGVVNFLFSKLIEMGRSRMILDHLKAWEETENNGLAFNELLRIAIVNKAEGIPDFIDKLLNHQEVTTEGKRLVISAVDNMVPGVDFKWALKWVDSLDGWLHPGETLVKPSLLRSIITHFPAQVDLPMLEQWCKMFPESEFNLRVAYAESHLEAELDEGLMQHILPYPKHVAQIHHLSKKVLFSVLGINNSSKDEQERMFKDFFSSISRKKSVPYIVEGITKKDVQAIIKLAMPWLLKDEDYKEKLAKFICSIQTKKGEFLFNFDEFSSLVKRYFFKVSILDEPWIKLLQGFEEAKMITLEFEKERLYVRSEATHSDEYIKKNASDPMHLEEIVFDKINFMGHFSLSPWERGYFGQWVNQIAKGAYTNVLVQFLLWTGGERKVDGLNFLHRKYLHPFLSSTVRDTWLDYFKQHKDSEPISRRIHQVFEQSLLKMSLKYVQQCLFEARRQIARHIVSYSGDSVSILTVIEQHEGLSSMAEQENMLKFLEELYAPEKISEKEEMIHEQPITEGYVPDFQRRQERLFENLSRPSQFINISNLKILSRVSWDILKRLDPPTLRELEVKVNVDGLKDPTERVLLFFELMEDFLRSMNSQKLNTTVNNWIKESSTATGYHLIRGLIQSSDRAMNVESLPPAMRDFLMSLGTDEGAFNAPSATQVENIAPQGVLKIETPKMSLAELITRIFISQSPKMPEVSLGDILKSIKSIPFVNFKDRDQILNSLVTGRLSTAFIQEMVQNARGAIRDLPPEQRQNRQEIKVKAYIVSSDDGTHKLVTQIEDEGVGMDDKVMLNELLLQGTSFYTILANLKEGDSIAVASSQGNGQSYFLSGQRGSTSLTSTTLAQFEDSNVKRGTKVQQVRVFKGATDLEKEKARQEARSAYFQLEKNLRLYCGAINDMDVLLNGENIASHRQLMANVGFGPEGISSLSLGGQNQVVSDGRVIATLESITQIQRYWKQIPSEVRDFLLSYGVITEMAPGILLNNSHTEYVQEEYTEMILKSESLKAMYTMARMILEGKVHDKTITHEKNLALDNFANDQKQNLPLVRRNAALLNFKDANGQVRYDKVDAKDMMDQWYALMIRLRIPIKTADGSIQWVSVAQRNGLSEELKVDLELASDDQFTLPPTRYFEKKKNDKQEVKDKVTIPGRLISFMRHAAAVSVVVGGLFFGSTVMSNLGLTGSLGVNTNGGDYMGYHDKGLKDEDISATSMRPLTGVEARGVENGEFVMTQRNATGEPKVEVFSQGKPTGEVEVFKYTLNNPPKEELPLPQIYSGVPTSVTVIDGNGQKDVNTSRLKDGIVSWTGSTSGPLKVIVQISKTDVPNRVVIGETHSKDGLVEEGAKWVPEDIKRSLREARKEGIAPMVSVLEGYIAAHVVYDNTTDVLLHGEPLMQVFRKTIERGEKMHGNCVVIARLQRHILEAVGERVMIARGFVNQEGRGLMPHEVAQVLDGNGEVHEVSQNVPVFKATYQVNSTGINFQGFIEGVRTFLYWTAMIGGLAFLGSVLWVAGLYVKRYLSGVFRSVIGPEDSPDDIKLNVKVVDNVAPLDENLLGKNPELPTQTEAEISKELPGTLPIVGKVQQERDNNDHLIEDLIGKSHLTHPQVGVLRNMLSQEKMKVVETLHTVMLILQGEYNKTNDPMWLFKNSLRFVRELGQNGEAKLVEYEQAHNWRGVIDYITKERGIRLAAQTDEPDLALISRLSDSLNKTIQGSVGHPWSDGRGIIKSNSDGAAISKAETGGIDLTSDKALQVKNDGNGKITFNLTSEQLAKLQNVPGFTPVIISIQPMTNLPEFLGLNAQVSSPAVSA
ncbi:MAG: hypothetical protein HQL15_08315 [Candidatus Omnitrophica bacterium]|nr:hypothetical protein [Candidatus Omnitrophota bacterium]